MTRVLSRIAAWHRRREERARRKHLVDCLTAVANESRRLGHPVLGDLIFTTASLWLEGHGERTLHALDREMRRINTEARYGTAEERGLC